MHERDMGDCYSREGLVESLGTTSQTALSWDEMKQCEDMLSVRLLTWRGTFASLGGI